MRQLGIFRELDHSQINGSTQTIVKKAYLNYFEYKKDMVINKAAFTLDVHTNHLKDINTVANKKIQSCPYKISTAMFIHSIDIQFQFIAKYSRIKLYP